MSEWVNEFVHHAVFVSCVKSNTTNGFTVSLALVSEPFISYTYFTHKNTHKRILLLSFNSTLTTHEKSSVFIFQSILLFCVLFLQLFFDSKQWIVLSSTINNQQIALWKRFLMNFSPFKYIKEKQTSSQLTIK